VTITVTLATFMELLDTSIANVALPHIAGGLGRSYDEATWILTTYLVANAVVLPLSAWLSRVLGRKNYYMICVALFTATSFLCGIAPSLGVMLFARILQGIGGGGLAPVEQAILVDTFPPAKRATAFAMYTMAVVAAPAIGPVLGGWITDSFSWRWVFFINIPIGILSLFMTSRFVHDPPSFEQERKTIRNAAGKLKIDGIGIALIGVGSGALEVLLDRGQIEDWFGSRLVTCMFVIAVVCLFTAVIWELRQEDPIIEFRMLRTRNFAVANIFYFLFGFTLFSSTTMTPEMLQTLFGYRAVDAGLVLGPGAMVITFLAPVGAVIVQKGLVQPRYMLLGSMAIVGSAFLLQGNFTLAADYGNFLRVRALQGLGYAFFFVPLSMIAYSELKPGENNKASSITNFFRNWGGSFGIAFVNTLAARRAQFHQSVIGTNLEASNSTMHQQITAMTRYLITKGMASSEAVRMAYGYVYEQLQIHSKFLAFMDCYWAIGVITLTIAPIVLLTRPFRLSRKASAGH
jgi:DHA2 family multidrug resistance protein